MTTGNFEPMEHEKAKALVEVAALRRRELLKGLGKGSLLMAASAVPLKTLASQSTCTHPGKDGAPVIRCGISGMQSGVGSRQTYTVCEGYSPGWWGQRADGCGDNDARPRRPWPVEPTSKCNDFFPKEGLSLRNGGSPTLFQIMDLSRFASSATRHWICAYLNALSGGPKGNFPYTGVEVLALYNGNPVGGVTYTQSAALQFFKNYMETHSS